MQLIEPSVSLITEKDPFKKIELAGRTCYKSEDKITETSAVPFVSRLIKAGHLAMVEHAIFYFSNTFDDLLLAQSIRNRMRKIPYSNTTLVATATGKFRVVFSANLRSLLENMIAEFNAETNELSFDVLDLVPCNYDDGMTEPEKLIHKYTTMRFITDRGVTHEFVRHRPFSFAQESTRYVKYNNDNMQFIKPAGYDSWSPKKQGIFLSALDTAEKYYNDLMANGAVAQEARAVLPNAIKTELVVTGNEKEWLHFFELRCDTHAHPDIQKIANMAKQLYYQGGNET